MLTSDQNKRILRLTYESEDIIEEAKRQYESDERFCIPLYALYEEYLNVESKYRSILIQEQNESILEQKMTSSSAKLKNAEDQLLSSLNMLEGFLYEIPGMRAFVSDSSRIQQRKYDEALRMTEINEPGETGYYQGMERFRRLDDYRDSRERFRKCNWMLFLQQTKMLRWIPTIIMMATAVIIWFASLRFMISSEWIRMMTTASEAFRDMQWQRILPVIINMGIAILGSGLATFAVIELVLLVLFLIRYDTMGHFLKYTSSEGEWELISGYSSVASSGIANTGSLTR